MFSHPLTLFIIIMDSALMTGDKSVSEQWNLKEGVTKVERRRGCPTFPDLVLQNAGEEGQDGAVGLFPPLRPSVSSPVGGAGPVLPPRLP